MKNNNVRIIDILRSLAIFFIISAHMDSFTNISFFHSYDIYFGYAGLIIFFFISGFLLPYTTKIASKSDMINSLKKKAIRIYPLFWLAVISSVAMNFLNIDVVGVELNASDFLISLIGLQGLLTMYEAPYALWYIGVIWIYYMAYHLISYCSSTLKEVVFNSCIFFAVLLMLRHQFGVVHINALEYYFVFIAGIVTGFACICDIRTNRKVTSVILSALLAVSLLFALCVWSYSCITTKVSLELVITEHIIITDYILETLELTIYASFILFSAIICKRSYYDVYRHIFNWSVLDKYVNSISYSSYAVYLFHIQILSLVKLVFEAFLPEGILIDYLFLLISVPLIFLIGFIIQKSHDSLLKLGHRK